jgi:soluble lytic murein transglycosylase-like protein
MSWQTENDGPVWMPTLNKTEDDYGIPRDLLARVAYQESHFITKIINGSWTSSAGAVGIMQLLPQFFPGAGINPTQDIGTAGKYLAVLYSRFNDWQTALAAYNWGPGNVDKCLKSGGTLASMPKETSDYVTDISGDIGLSGNLLPVMDA